MKRFEKFAALTAVCAMLCSGMAFAEDHNDGQHDNHTYVQHKEWKKGSHINQNDWSRGDQVDYHAHHLRTPPRGYEWRETDGNYVLAAVATGIIASVIAESAAH